MHIFFSGIGGTGIGPLALIALKAGHKVSGSDKQSSKYIDYLKTKGITNITIGQTEEAVAKINSNTPIDWLVYSSAVSIENSDHPELAFAQQNNIKMSKRDELLNKIITDNNLKLIAVAGTHGKTTTTAMVVWLFKELNLPVSYSVGAKIEFGEMGQFDPKSEYFVYECDEFDRNFLAFKPYLGLISGVAYDHQDIFPTEQDYVHAFGEFLAQSKHKILWHNDAQKFEIDNTFTVLDEQNPDIKNVALLGQVNRLNGWLAIQAVRSINDTRLLDLVRAMNAFPGVSRRFEKISDNLYTDYAHTAEKISGCLELARETSENVVVVYEPLTNKRQYFIRDQYKDLFKDVKKLYWVPSYLTREDPSQPVLTPAELIKNMDNAEIAEPADLDENLKDKIRHHIKNGDTVVCLSGGGGGSLDEWLRINF